MDTKPPLRDFLNQLGEELGTPVFTEKDLNPFYAYVQWLPYLQKEEYKPLLLNKLSEEEAPIANAVVEYMKETTTHLFNNRYRMYIYLLFFIFLHFFFSFFLFFFFSFFLFFFFSFSLFLFFSFSLFFFFSFFHFFHFFFFFFFFYSSRWQNADVQYQNWDKLIDYINARRYFLPFSLPLSFA